MSEPEAAAAAPAEPATTPAPAAAAVVAEPPKPVVKQITYTRTSISNLTKENFSTTLSDIEPFLLNGAGRNFLAKSLKRISRASKVLGVPVPTGYGKEAAATSKRGEKQDAFVKGKIEALACDS